MPVGITSRLDIKLFLMVMMVIMLSIIPLAYTSWKAFNGYGQKASAIHEEQLRRQIISGMKRLAGKQVAGYQAFFDRISVSAGLLGSQASTIYSDLDLYAQKPLFNYTYRKQPFNGIWANSFDDPIVSLYWGGITLVPQVEKELKALTHMVPLFQRVVEENPEALASHLISASGIGQYCSDNQKNRQAAMTLPPPGKFDLRTGEPMTIFSKQKDGHTGVRWTGVYQDDIIDGLMLTASAPIYDNHGIFRGITGIDIPLRTIADDVLSIDYPQTDSLVEFAFLVDGEGRIIAFPEAFFAPFGLVFDRAMFNNSADKLTVSLKDSTKNDVRDLANNIIANRDFFAKLDLGDESYFIVTDKLDKLGWILGIVVDQDVVFEPFVKGRNALEKIVGDMGRKGGFLALLSIVVSLFIVFICVKYLVLPLRTLSVATQRVAGGDFSVRCPVNTSDETGVLAASFNTMVERLQMAQERQKRYADSLEVEVDRRNRELIDKRGELEMTIELLKKEIERRQIISEALKNSQQQYYETMEATQAGIFIMTDGVFNYVNTSLADMMRSSAGEMIGVDPFAFVAEEDRGRVQENLEKRQQGQDIAPYRIKCMRRDSTTFFGEIWAKVTTWQEKTAIVGTISDVSNVKLNEEKLEAQDVQLRKSLAEKEILLKEIYHRTKNNMLVIISMLELQTCDIDDERVKSIFQETESRIRAMALVHEKLYRSRNLSEIDLGDYIKEVASSLIANMVMDQKITLHMQLEPVAINIDYAIPLGLVINEIVTNSVKHAFPGNRIGGVFINLTKEPDGRIVLGIGDNGIGLPHEIDLGNCTSFGLQMVYSLIKMQLKGSVVLDRENGTSFHVYFQEPKRQERI